jgi:DNA-directed RNA polymerase sigma subunit (sigma70/sigma32)
MPASDLEVSVAPDGLPAELGQSLSTAITTLTDREFSAVLLRFGFSTGKPESFGVVGRELGVNRVRAQAIFRNAIQSLRANDETRGLTTRRWGTPDQLAEAVVVGASVAGAHG